MYKLLRKTILFLPLLLLFTKDSLAVTYDFEMINSTTINYTTGQDHVDVTTQFQRRVNNKEYFFSTQGEKIFHIPDSTTGNDEEIKEEREYKLSNLSVTNITGSNVDYNIEELELGQGIYVKVPNYRETTYSSPYTIYLNYKTHIYLRSVKDWVAIQIPALHEDTQFTQTDDSSNTSTKVEYNLNVVVDSNISPLAKIYPLKYSVIPNSDRTTYSFNGEDRVGEPVYLEFGTNRVFRFESRLKTPKTDTIVPEKYSSAFSALSTNIYSVPLPRDFGENNQRVLIENISPQPSKVTTDLEGNIVATFEVPANKESEIYISGYIWVEQNTLEEIKSLPNITYSEYISTVKGDSNLSKYLSSTKYWETTDTFITSKASELSKDANTLMDVIRNDYTYVNDVLEYDFSKAESENERIGAKAALLGGGSVCMEYSDSMIALLRAQGIPTRAAVGYIGIEENKESNIPHQWVQVWVPEYGWLSIDPTYESKNMQIGANIDSVLWETFFDDNETNLGIYTADSVNTKSFTKENYNISVYAIDESEIPDTTSLLSYSDIATEEKELNMQESLNIIAKTTPIGKAMIVVLPIGIVLVLLIVLLSLITVLTKRIRSQKASPN